ncbi:Hypothetical protein SMAX5B_007783 [Scophthalmus maximus]|nr:Hypothetical protein SMAX5B_007783 [Scophthalmus maximus]AWO98096.1 Hypothetical protein SMAX5B_007783 [Scophthalmus maximus]AWO98097.1 Hypothetical protein SMAX5B_007783 [Scophthalmus maximus]AWO98098.1 Hypothetical protein SMAX5B_007783 [Scophthalmus maximus]AWO98099.1 Hypothetical protein SMAX5B_007783 [Scophthalmus maximus]
MAAASSLLSEERFLCSVCLDVFTQPVSIPWGHDFCSARIHKYWDSSDTCQCPSCKRTFSTRPELRVNTIMSELADELKKLINAKSVESEKEKRATEQVFTGLIRSVRRSQAELVEVIKARHRPTKQQAEGFLKELRTEIAERESRSSRLEQLSQSEDHYGFLQSLPTFCSPSNEDRTDTDAHGDLSIEAARGTVTLLRRKFGEIMEDIPEIKRKA